jgi:nucleoside-diphosphate-sugar epimerase
MIRGGDWPLKAPWLWKSDLLRIGTQCLNSGGHESSNSGTFWRDFMHQADFVRVANRALASVPCRFGAISRMSVTRGLHADRLARRCGVPKVQAPLGRWKPGQRNRRDSSDPPMGRSRSPEYNTSGPLEKSRAFRSPPSFSSGRKSSWREEQSWDAVWFF